MTGVRVACYARSVDILIHEVKREHWATGGKLWSDA
jgi:4-oxalocrotonate tautomerase